MLLTKTFYNDIIPMQNHLIVSMNKSREIYRFHYDKKFYLFIIHTIYKINKNSEKISTD